MLMERPWAELGSGSRGPHGGGVGAQGPGAGHSELSCHSEQVLGFRGATGFFLCRPTGVYFLLSLPHCAYSRFFFYHFIPECIRLCPSKKKKK